MTQMAQMAQFSFFNSRVQLKNITQIYSDYNIRTLQQVHSNKVILASHIESTIAPIADGIISTNSSDILAIKTADCVPVLLQHKKQQVVAALHCGWRSVHSGIIQQCQRQMSDLGFVFADLTAHIGPSIRAENYMVSHQFKKNIVSNHPPAIHCFKQFHNDCFFDLPSWVQNQLQSVGIGEVHDTKVDTFANKDFASYRRNNLTGQDNSLRQYSIIHL